MSVRPLADIEILKLFDPQSNATPMRFSLRQTTWQGRRKPSATSVKCSGIPIGLVTSSAAPVLDQLRTMQSIAPPLNSMVPAFKTQCRGAVRLSSLNGELRENPKKSIKV